MRAYAARSMLMILSVALGMSAPALGQEAYPSRPIRFIVAAAVGGGNDVSARRFAPRLSELLNQSIVVENRPGASGTIGAELVANSPPDGYTMLYGGSGEMAAYPALGVPTRYDPDRDFVTVSVNSLTYYSLFASAASGIRSVADLIAKAKASPDSVTCATAGRGSAEHLTCAWVAARAEIRLRMVDYKGGGPAALDAANGVVDLVPNIASVVKRQYVDPGKLVPIAVLGPRRMKSWPDVPTAAEAGLSGVEVTTWAAAFAPAGTQPDIVARMNAEFRRASDHPYIVEVYRALDVVFPMWSPQQGADFVRGEREKWRRLSSQLNIRLEQ